MGRSVFLTTLLAGGLLFLIAGCGLSSDLRDQTSAKTVWDDDFERYETGSFPSGWEPSGNADAGGSQVVSSHSQSGAQALRLKGTPGGCWEAISFRPLGVTPSEDFEVSFFVRPTTEGEEGCHEHQAGVYLRTDPAWDEDGRQLLSFRTDGRLSWGEASYSPGEWTKVRIRYQYQRDGNQVQLTYWLDEEKKATQELEAQDYEPILSYIGFRSGDFTVYYDMISVREI